MSDERESYVIPRSVLRDEESLRLSERFLASLGMTIQDSK